jgi:hypothetical protein
MNDFDHVAWDWLAEWSLMIAWVGSDCLPDGDAWCGWVMDGRFVEADRWDGEFELNSVICFGSLFCDASTPCREGSWCGRVVGLFAHRVVSGWCCCHCRFQFLVEAKRDLKKFFFDSVAWWFGTNECNACSAVRMFYLLYAWVLLMLNFKSGTILWSMLLRTMSEQTKSRIVRDVRSHDPIAKLW